ncbi:sodium transporter HKT1-like [Lycium ferocissimum]|uniref:sodium transporter HKT1-like n=1 Tax=Lycium ferocissimum TaxID=112874 RepID=UPI002815BB4F|nr:sodium transporter HKT1-like [Lycium ferocissimum]
MDEMKIREHFSSSSRLDFLFPFLRTLSFRVTRFWFELTYFIILSLLGFLALNVSSFRTLPSFRPKNLDLFFTSVSSITVSSMATVEMEVFSDIQLVFITILMFLGGEVFISFLGLQLMKYFNDIDNKESILVQNKVDFDSSNYSIHQLELGMVTIDHHLRDHENFDVKLGPTFKLKCIRFLGYVVLGYILVVVFLGYSLVSMYMSFSPSAPHILNEKGLNFRTFSLFTTVSTFANCGFAPTNENMIIFKKNSGFLLILIPQILLGNTLYPPFLRLTIWFLWKITKREEFNHILKDSKRLGYSQLFPSYETISLVITVLGFIFVQFIVFCSLEWYSEATYGLSAKEKLVGSLFEVVNSRHAGESVFDLSTLSPAILLVFILMMYLSPYGCFLPVDSCQGSWKITKRINRRKGSNLVEIIMFSQLSYVVIFTILICITERDKMKNDPLNFSVLNIVFEVVSAYGNVGLSMGYSCARQVKPNGHCKDAMYGFAGRWSGTGKFILIVVMFMGKLKKYNKRGGKAWKLL